MPEEIVFNPIGIIHSPYKDTDKIPIQPVFAGAVKGYIKLYPEYVEGLKDLDGFSHIYLFFYLHKSRKTKLVTIPFLEDNEHGIFATRSPSRPNKLGMSLVRLDKIVGNILHISEIDILDGTPLIDIKPFTERFDKRKNVRQGWLENLDPEEIEKRIRQREGFDTT